LPRGSRADGLLGMKRRMVLGCSFSRSAAKATVQISSDPQRPVPVDRPRSGAVWCELRAGGSGRRPWAGTRTAATSRILRRFFLRSTASISASLMPRRRRLLLEQDDALLGRLRDRRSGLGGISRQWGLIHSRRGRAATAPQPPRAMARASSNPGALRPCRKPASTILPMVCRTSGLPGGRGGRRRCGPGIPPR